MVKKTDNLTVRTFLESVARVVVVFLFVGAIVALVEMVYDHYARTRTATVRQVFLHGANQFHMPEVYMNDGTVWVLFDYPNDVRMIRGDEVRYENAGPADRSDCNLYDVTTGYRSPEAMRISAPFKHTSCPIESPIDRWASGNGN